LGRRAPQDLRAYIDAQATPMQAHFRQVMGESFADFIRRWRVEHGRLAALPDHDQGAPQRWPIRPTTALSAQKRAGYPVVEYRFQFAAPAPAGATCSLLHAELTAFDWPLPDSELIREDHLCEAVDGRLLTLDTAYASGQRAYLALQIEDLESGYVVRRDAQRLELP